jgi:hypothetical protein
MGCAVNANCPCGLATSSLVGGGMATFETTCVVQVNLLDAEKHCPNCEASAVVPYDSQELSRSPGKDVVAEWNIPDILGRNLRLHDGTYEFWDPDSGGLPQKVRDVERLRQGEHRQQIELVRRQPSHRFDIAWRRSLPCAVHDCPLGLPSNVAPAESLARLRGTLGARPKGRGSGEQQGSRGATPSAASSSNNAKAASTATRATLSTRTSLRATATPQAMRG